MGLDVIHQKTPFVFHICTLTTWTLQIKLYYLRLFSAEIPNTFQEFLLYFICEFKYFVQDFNLEIPLLIVTLSAYLYCPGAHELNRLAYCPWRTVTKARKYIATINAMNLWTLLSGKYSHFHLWLSSFQKKNIGLYIFLMGFVRFP